MRTMVFKTQPWKHQLEMLARFQDTNEAALFWEMGTGKTKGAIEWIRMKCYQNKRQLNSLVLCPVVVMHNWADEIALHSYMPATVLEGPISKRAAVLRKSDTPGIFITGYEALLNPKFFEIVCKNIELVVYDEVHRLKTHSAQRSKAAYGLSKTVKYRLALTGTPILNSPMDLFGIFKALDCGDTFGDNFFEFRNKYFYDRNASMVNYRHFPDWKLRPTVEAELNEKMTRKSMRVLKNACLDLPPLVKKIIPVEMNEVQTKAYKEMREHLVTFIGNTSIATASIALTKMLRLMQIVSGFVTTEGGSNVSFKETPRDTALRELLSELAPTHKTIVWACFRENYARIRAICAELQLPFVEITGEASASERAEAADKFNTDPRYRVCLGNPASGGIGINLTAASYQIFYSRTFSLEHDLQAEARCYRGGSEIHSKVTRLDLVCPGTIEEKVVKALRDKKNVADTIIDFAKAELLD